MAQRMARRTETKKPPQRMEIPKRKQRRRRLLRKRQKRKPNLKINAR
nr:unnamed protein product [Callosobruchus chinensis]